MAAFPRTTRYTRPGSYLGQVFRPRATAVSGVVFRPCFVGKGARLALAKNASVARSWIEGKALTFTSAPPYIATLTYAAKNDKTPPVSLFDGDGTEVSTLKWQFQESTPGSGQYNQVFFNAADYDRDKSYYLDYQSSSRDFQDPMPFNDLRRIVRVGQFQNQDLYKESLNPADEDDEGDFVIPGTVGSFSANAGNTYPDPATSNITATKTGTGSVAFGSGNDPSNDYTKYYVLEVTAIGAGPKSATFKITTYLHSGGNNTGHQVPLTSGVSVKTFTVEEGGTGNVLDTNRLLMDGIYLDYTFGGTNFVVTDKFEFFSYGPGKFEEHSAFDENNEQFTSISSVSGTGNVNWATNPPSTTDNTSEATFAAGSLAEYDGEFIRHFRMEVTAAAGTAATGSLTFTLASMSDNEHFTLHNGLEAVTFEFQKTAGYIPVSGRVTIDIQAAATDADVAIAAAAAINLNTNWPLGTAEITAVPAVAVVNLTADNNGADCNVTITAYESDNTTPSTGIAHTGMTGGQRTATIAWAGADELPYTTGSMSLDDTVSTSYTNVLLEDGVRLTVTWPAVTGVAFVVGDTFEFVARPGRQYYTAKDDRVYTLTVTAASVTATTSSVSGTYAATTREGGFGQFYAVIAADGSGGLVKKGSTGADFFDDNIMFFARNAGNNLDTPTGIDAPTRQVANDVHTFSATCDDVIDWAIDRRTTETIQASAIIYDAIGTVTGVPGTYYVILDNTPDAIISVKNASSGASISYSWVPSSPYIYFSSDPGVSISVRYQWMGREPNPGQIYYVTGTRLRSAVEYDMALLWRSMDTCRDGLQPAGIDNDILIAAEIGNDSGNMTEFYTLQVKDLDDDGIYQLSDYKRAIQATELQPAITDVCVLNKFGAVGAAIQSVENSNDMFNYPSSVRMLWVGMPVNSPVGDEDTEDSIIYTSKRTLQVSGNSPSHGCHVLIGNTEAKREIALDDGSTKTITVDGSFIAAAAMSKQAGFTDPADTLLYKTLGSVFTYMQEFTDAEQLALGGSHVTFLTKTGESVYRFAEDITTDPAAIDYLQINAMKQKHYVVKTVTQQAGERLTGFVPPDPFAAITTIQSFIAELLGNLVGAGFIAPYGSEQNPPTRRPINPTNDVKVYMDETIRTDFYYVFFFNLRYPIKRTTGLFGVDSDEIIKGVAKVV